MLDARNHELEDAELLQYVLDATDKHFADKEAQVGGEIMRQLEKHLMLNVLDQSWKDHLARMDYLRQGIHLRGYAQKQPKQEYKREAFELFSEMLDKVKRDVVNLLARVRIRTESEIEHMEAAERERQQAQARRMQFQHPESGGLGADEEAAVAVGAGHAGAQPVQRDAPKVGRNDPCPCGSGKKFKHCHGQLA
jgi:preprotein translocase subunit SecA